MLYYHYYSYGLTVCLHYAHNREEAEEILHDGFLKVFFKMDQLKDDESFRYWFRSILVRLAVDYYRRKNKVAEKSMGRPVYSTDNVENEAVHKLERTDVMLILQQLSPQYRMVFNLYVLEGYRHEEIAEMLEISVNTSKSNLSRAKQKLRQLLQPCITFKDFNGL